MGLIEELEKKVEKNLVSKAVNGDLAIYCYKPECVYEKAWDKYTKMARGLIVNTKTGEIVARPFTKFFNLNEVEETKLENLPMEEPEITEKLDGSLGIFYQDEGEYFITTKGTFYSEQAEWATNYFRKKFSKSKIPKGLTLLFEVIYPENRIVIDYCGLKEMFLIGIIEIETGRDYSYRELEEFGKRFGISIVKTVPLKMRDIVESLKELPADEEGFVARYSNGLRVKMKGVDYLKIHRILSKLSLISIWEKLKEESFDKEFVATVPEEFREWIEKTAEILLKSKKRIEKEAEDLFRVYKGKKERKEFALWAQKQEYKALLFFLYDKNQKKMDQLIFSMIRPTGNRYHPIHGVSEKDTGEERLDRIREENL